MIAYARARRSRDQLDTGRHEPRDLLGQDSRVGTGFELKVLAMTFKTDGFLSPTMEEFRTSLREVPAYKLWFEFAEELNRLGWAMLEDHETPTTDNQRLIISVLFIRAHQSFQAAITLIERGMLADARVVLRSAVEGAVALNVLANDASFDMQLIEAHLHNQRKTARIVLNTPEYRSGYAAAEIAQMETTIKEITDKEAAVGREFRDIIPAALTHLIHRTSWPQCHYVYTTDMYTPRRRLT